LRSNRYFCDRRGIIADGSRDQLKASIGEGTLRLRVPDDEQRRRAAGMLESRLGVSADWNAGSTELTARLSGDGAGLAGQAATAVAELTGEGLDVRDFTYGQPSLDEVFLALTGTPAEETGDGASG
jgi:ABC-2 type transport system ATP-binding protein